MRSKIRIVCVAWEDAVSSPGYYDYDHPENFSPSKCRTVGHLISKTKDKVVVAGEYFEDGDLRHIHTIPRKMVTKITYLESVK